MWLNAAHMNRYFLPGRCPDCGAPLSGADRCARCGLLQAGPVADDLRFALHHADQVLDVLRRVSTPAPPPPAPAMGEPAAPTWPTGQTPPPGVSATPPAATAPPGARRGLPAVSVPVVLLGLGTICVLVAAVVFVAVTWTDLSLGWRTTILLGITALATGAALWSLRLGLRGAAEALTLVASGLLLIDMLAGNDAGLPLLSAIQGRAFDWLVAIVMLAAAVGWALGAQRTRTRWLLGQQVVAVLACVAMVWLAALDWSYEPAWLAAVVTLAAASVGLGLWRIRLSVTAVFLGVGAVLAWVYLTAAGVLLAVLADGPRPLFLGLDSGPLLTSGAIAAAVAVLPGLHVAARTTAAVFAVAAPVVVVLLPARELSPTYTMLLVSVAAFVLAVAAVACRTPWRNALCVVSAGTTLPPAFVLAFGAELALVRVGRAAYEPWTLGLTDPLPAVTAGPDVAAWAYLPLAALVAAALWLALFRPLGVSGAASCAVTLAGIGALTSLLSGSWSLLVVGFVLAAAAAAGVVALAGRPTRLVLTVTAVPVALGVGAALPSVGASALFLAAHGVLLVLAAGLLRDRLRSVLVALGVATGAVSLEACADLVGLSVASAGVVLLLASIAVLLTAEVLATRPDGGSWRVGLEVVVVPMAAVALLQTGDGEVARLGALVAAAVAAGAVAALVEDRWWLACVCAVLVGASAGQAVQVAGGAVEWSAVAVSAVAALTAVAAQRLLRDRPVGGQQLATWARGSRPALELTGVLMGAVSVSVQQEDALALTVGLTFLGVGAVAVSFLSADRRRAAWLGSGLLVLASWVRLSSLDVDVVEAYTLPGALALLVFGLLWMRRHPDASSWRGLATPLTLGLGPSLVVALQEPTTVRALLVGLAGLALVGVGVRLGWGAPLVVGGVAVGLLAVVNIAPYAAAVPRWVLFGTAGVALLALGVTWERRRQDLHLMHRYAASLR
jgi:hypothetical protein